MKEDADSRPPVDRGLKPAHEARPRGRRVLGLCALAVCLAGLGAAGPRAQDEGPTRSLWDTAFGAAPKRTAPRRKPARRDYRSLTPRVPPARVAPDAVVGVTVWRLRPSGAARAGERLLTHEGAGTLSWVPERVPSDAPLAEGDRVRLSIEPARAGYLYVIDRELYADGTAGEPYLIFPTTRTLGGDNRVEAGRLVDLPAQDDSPPYFTLRRSRADQTGESLQVLITREPLEGLEIGPRPQRLPAAPFAAWEKAWGGQAAGRLELAGGAGRPWTKEEREAGAHVRRKLTADAPAPQTLYYRPGADPGKPLSVEVELRYARPAARRPRRR